MKTEYIDKCFEIFMCWGDDENPGKIGGIMSKTIPFELETMFKNVKKEIDDNLFESQALEGKIYIIRWYMNSFRYLGDIYFEMGNYLRDKRWPLGGFNKKTKLQLLDDSLSLWDNIHFHLEECCKIIPLDFYKLCDEFNLANSSQFYYWDIKGNLIKTRHFRITKDYHKVFWGLKKESLIPKEQPKEEKLSLKEIALLCSYEEGELTDEKVRLLKNNYGFTAVHKLKQLYNNFNTPSKRLKHETQLKAKNQIERIEKIIPLITSPKGKQSAREECDLLIKKIAS